MAVQQKQYMPQEIEVWYIIPGLRRELANAMSSKGRSQKRIAELLGITEAAVSQYVKHKRASEVEFQPETLAEISRSAERIAGDPESMVCEMQRLLAIVKRSKTLCRVHYRFGRTPRKCEACMGIKKDAEAGRKQGNQGEM